MNNVLKTTFIATAIAASTLAWMPAANAQDYWDYENYGVGAMGAGILDLTVGALGVNAAESVGSRYYETPNFSPDYSYIGPDVGEPSFTYVEPIYPVVQPDYTYESYISPVPAYTENYVVVSQPWSPEWYRYCEGRYRTFNARTGTFTGYDGLQHFCAG